MTTQIITKPLNLNIHGFSGVAINKDYAGTAFKLMDKMWQVVKVNNLKNKGLNIWVYEQYEKVFTGVELEETPKNDFGLEQKSLSLQKYAYYKHIGSYNLIKQMGQNMKNELLQSGFDIDSTYIEIYGHWTNDESKLETELLMCLK